MTIDFLGAVLSQSAASSIPIRDHPADLDHGFYRQHAIMPPSELFRIMDGVYYFAKDAAGRFVVSNKLLQERFELTRPEDVIGRTDHDFFSDEVADRLRADDLAVMRSGECIRHKLELVESHEGNVCWLFTSKSPLRAADGSVVGVEGVSTDAEKVVKSLKPYQEFKDIIPFIHRNYAADITVTQLANLACMSVATLERRFHSNFNCTPKAYITAIRIKEACRRLEAGQHIKRISQDLGFTDQSHFTKTFKRIMGRPPRKFLTSMATARTAGE